MNQYGNFLASKAVKALAVVVILAIIILVNNSNVALASSPLLLPQVTTNSNADKDENSSTSPIRPAKEKVAPVETEKLDVAGQKISQSIDIIGQKAANFFGSWINANLILGITWLKLLTCLFLIFLVVVCERLIRLSIHRRLIRLHELGRETTWLYLLLHTIQAPLSLFIWVYGIYGAISPLFIHFRSPDGSNLVHSIVSRAADVGGTIAIIWIFYRLVAFVDIRLHSWARLTGNAVNLMIVPLVGRSLRIFVVIVGSIMILQTLTGIDVGPIIASLGIGGLALALAAKGSVENFFGTLTIIFDQPFQVGDRIVVDGYDGTVEMVGFRSIRLRTLTGHLVTIPNDRIVTSSIENISKRPHIRWNTNITITYDTPPEKVKRAVEIVEEILENHEGMHPDFPPRVYFNGFNDWSLNISVFAWYHPADYWAYQAWLQKTCLSIFEEFEQEGIDFAFPTQTVYLTYDERQRLALNILLGDKGEIGKEASAVAIPENQGV